MASTTSISKSAVGVINTGNMNVAGNINVQHPITLPFENFSLPGLIDTFHGRDDEMVILDTLLFSGSKRKVVICGLPGFGKTELSKQFAQRCLNSGKVNKVVWIKAEKREDVEDSYRKLHKIYEQYDASCLYVFDNGVCRRDIAGYEPPARDNVYMLVTSRERIWGEDVTSIQLNPLSRQSAQDIFKSILKDNYKTEDYHLYVQLAEVVDNVPLGLQILAGYVRQQTQTDILKKLFNLSEYVQEIQQSPDIMKKQIPRDISNNYEKSINKIKEEDDTKVRDLTLNMLYACSYLNPDSIYVEDLLKMSHMKPVYDKNKIRLEHSLGLLVNFSFVNRNFGSYRSYIRMHRLVQNFFRLYLSECGLENLYFCSCLYSAVFVNQFSRYTKSVSTHAETYIDIVLNYYKEQKCNVDKILNWLVQCGCINCLDKIFKDNKNEKKHIFECKLLYTAIEYHQVNILKQLLNYVIISRKIEYRDILFKAIEKGNREIINILINHGINVHVINNEGDTPIFAFVKHAHLSADVKNWNDILQMFEFDKNIMNNNQETLLHLAAAHYHDELIEILISDHDLNINQQDARGRTPVHAFCYSLSSLELVLPKTSPLYPRSCKTTTIVNQFIKHNVLLNLEDSVSCTTGYLLLEYAVKFNELDILKWLLQQNVDVNQTPNNRETVLHTAATTGNLEIIQILINHGGNVHVVNEAGDTPLFVFTKQKNLSPQVDWIKILDMFDFDKTSTNNDKETLLHLAAANNAFNLVEILISNFEMDVNHQDVQGWTALDVLLYNISLRVGSKISEMHRIIAILAQFVKKNASLNQVLNNITAEFLLYHTIKHNELEVLKWLLQHGADVNNTNKSLLHMAASKGNLETMQILISHGADVNATDVDGWIWTVLYYFVRDGYRKNMDMDDVKNTLDILNCKGHKNILFNWINEGYNLLHLAARKNHEYLVTLLVQEYEFDVNIQDFYGDTPLHYLIYGINDEFNKEDVVKTVQSLIRLGASLNIKNVQNLSALHLAQCLSKTRVFDFEYLFAYLTPTPTEAKP